MTTTAVTEIHPSATRAVTNAGWLDSRHSFSFGPHQIPSNMGHGLLIVSNDDRVAAGGGFGAHGHKDTEIVTWVLNGELAHQDSAGNQGVLYPGLVQRMSAGTGIRHSEMNPSLTTPVRFVQMWVVPDTTGVAPSYEQLDVNAALDAGGLVTVASGQKHPGAVHIQQSGAAMHVARLTDRETVALPDARFVHVFVAHGAIELGDERRPLNEGDAARLTDAGRVAITSNGASEVIVWESDSEVQR